MANYQILKADLDNIIKTNTSRAITGDVLNGQLDAMIDALGTGYQYMGMATTATNPGTPDARVVYLASTPGTYTHFENLALTSGKIAFFRWDGFWHKDEVEVQPVLTMDDTPTEGSDNPVKSGGIFDALFLKEDTANKVGSISPQSTDEQYASAKCVYDYISGLLRNIISFPVFEIDTDMHLTISSPDQSALSLFSVDSSGHLIMTIN